MKTKTIDLKNMSCPEAYDYLKKHGKNGDNVQVEESDGHITEYKIQSLDGIPFLIEKK